jgi:hypothetical protein
VVFSPHEARTVLTRDEVVYRASQRIVTLSAAHDGVIVGTKFGHPKLYVVPTSANTPMHVEAALGEQTGAVNDFQAVAWTKQGEVVTEGNLLDRSVYMKTRPGEKGSVLARLDVTAFGKGTMTGQKVLYLGYVLTSEGRSCVLGTLATDTGAITEWRRGDCSKQPVLSCASAVPRCIVRENDGTGAPSWFDLETRTTIGPAPIVSGALAPDATSYAEVDPDLRITIHSLAGRETEAITPDPPFSAAPADVAYISLDWMPDGRSLLLLLSSLEHGGSRLIQLDRDGRWRVLAESESMSFFGPLPSPDGAKVAMTASAASYAWSLLPILALH